MAIKELKNERIVRKDDDGKFEFTHTLVQQMDQSNVNALVEKYRTDKVNSSNFLKEYDNILDDVKNKTRSEFEARKKEMQEYLDSVTDDNKVELALELFEKSLAIKQEFIDNFDEHLEAQYKTIEDKYMLPQKLNSMKVKDDADKTLAIWDEHYEQNEQ